MNAWEEQQILDTAKKAAHILCTFRRILLDDGVSDEHAFSLTKVYAEFMLSGETSDGDL